MSYPQIKSHLQMPKSYQDLTRSRLTKKRNYNYTQYPDIYQDLVSIPLTNMQGIEKYRQYSKERIQTKSKNQLFEIGYTKSANSIITQINLKLELSSFQSGQKIVDQKKNKQAQNKIPNTQQIKVQDGYQIRSDLNYKLGYSQTSPQKQNFSLISPQASRDISKYSYKNQLEQVPNKNEVNKSIKIEIVAQPSHDKENKQSKKNPQISCQKNNLNQKNKQFLQPLVQKALRKVQYCYGQDKIDKEKIRQEVEQNYQKAVKMQKILSKQCELDIQIEQTMKKILNNSPLMMPPGITIVEESQLFFNPQIRKLSDYLSKLIQLDINLLKIRQDFQILQVEDKWQKLNSKLADKNIQLQINELKEYISVSLYQKDPFGFKRANQKIELIEELAGLFASSHRFWLQSIDKCCSLEKINSQGSRRLVQDLQVKSIIDLQDIVCFVNVNSQKLYRSRDVFSLFRRFLKLQGKKFDKKVSLCTIKFSTFISKLAN